MDTRQRVFSRETVREKCSWLSSYPEFDVPKTAGPRFRATFGLLSSRSYLPSKSSIPLRKRLQRDGASVVTQFLETRQKNEEENSYMRYYSPQQHKFTKEKVGEIQLPVPIFQLVPPTLETFQSERAVTVAPPRSVTFNHEPAKVLLKELKTYQLQFLRPPANRKRSLLLCLRDLRAMSFTPEDLSIYQSHFNTVPYQQPKSKEFLSACKIGDEWTARRLLELNPYLVLAFDSTQETGLHWAAKRNHTHIIELLYRWKAQINIRDEVTSTQSGQTPLYHAAKAGSFEAVRDLVCLKADPRRETITGDTPIRVSKDPAIESVLKRAMLVRGMQLDIFMKYAPRERRDYIWRDEGLKYFNLDLKILRHRR